MSLANYPDFLAEQEMDPALLLDTGTPIVPQENLPCPPPPCCTMFCRPKLSANFAAVQMEWCRDSQVQWRERCSGFGTGGITLWPLGASRISLPGCCCFAVNFSVDLSGCENPISSELTLWNSTYLLWGADFYAPGGSGRATLSGNAILYTPPSPIPNRLMLTLHDPQRVKIERGFIQIVEL